MLQRIIKIIFALTLLYSGYENLFPIETMEYRFFEQDLASWYTVAVMVRLMIGMKWVLALFLLFDRKASRFVFMLLILIFLPHLNDSYWRLVADNIIINDSYVDLFGEGWGALVFMGLFILVIYFERHSWKANWFNHKPYLNAILIFPFCLPFIFNPVFPQDFTDQGLILEESTSMLDSLLPASLAEEPFLLLSFYSTNCPHCLNAAKKIAVTKKKHRRAFPKCYSFFIGSEEGVQHFMKEANVKLDYQILNTDKFIALNGSSFPGFILKEHDQLKKWDGRTFNYMAVQSLLRFD